MGNGNSEMIVGPFGVEAEGGSRSASAITDDFAALILIFDRHLEQLPANAQTRAHFERARKSAERGMQLSKQLINLRQQG